MSFKNQVRADLQLIKQDLAEHMRRTELLEGRLDGFWTRSLTALSLISGLVVLVNQLRLFLH